MKEGEDERKKREREKKMNEVEKEEVRKSKTMENERMIGRKRQRVGAWEGKGEGGHLRIRLSSNWVCNGLKTRPQPTKDRI